MPQTTGANGGVENGRFQRVRRRQQQTLPPDEVVQDGRKLNRVVGW
ncbi:MAG: hypothetical protein IPM76_14655 [Chloroflexi bacterium]|nr:hypothetical protein [Chloroflexota bacterium]